MKKVVFSNKTVKNCFGGHIWPFFMERRRLALVYSQIRYWIFYYLSFFQKKKTIFREDDKKPFLGGQVPFEGKGASSDENEYNIFYGKWGLNILSFNNFFEKSTIFGDNGEKILGDMTIF